MDLMQRISAILPLVKFTLNEYNIVCQCSLELNVHVAILIL